jgi:hypothetical protein
LSETAAYIASRIRTAGGEAARLFTREAVTLIHEGARGIPRTISVICDNALLSGFAAERQPVDRDLVMEVVRDFDLRPEPSSAFVALPVDQPQDAGQDREGADGASDSGTADTDESEMFGPVARRRRFSLFGSS